MQARGATITFLLKLLLLRGQCIHLTPIDGPTIGGCITVVISLSMGKHVAQEGYGRLANAAVSTAGHAAERWLLWWWLLLSVSRRWWWFAGGKGTGPVFTESAAVALFGGKLSG